MPEALRQLLNDIRQRFSSLQNNQKIVVMVGAATLIALLIAAYIWTTSVSYKVLFSNLSDRDGGSITTALQAMNVPYRVESGGVVTVPAEQVYDVRLKLASQGLPKGGTVGFELMENEKFGISQFAEQVNYQRAIEGELARSIETLASVQSARVHLAIPRATVFVREQQKPSASVLVTLHPGRVLDSPQVAAIAHLISSAVPEMPLNNVTVVDQNGNLLSSNMDGANPGGLDSRQLSYVRQLEQVFVKRIENILQPIVGNGNLKAEVTATLDFAETEQTSEVFKPNSPPEKQSIRSQQTNETLNGGNQAASGVPGAFSNQPPGAATAPLNLPAGGSGPQQNATPPTSSHREATINYEVDKTVQHTKLPVGSIKRLAAGVVVNYKAVVDPAGKTTFKALTPQELAQINSLVKQAMGFNTDRGDTLNVVNAPFAEATEPSSLVDRLTEAALTNWQEIFKQVLIALVVLYLILGVIRPAVRYLTRVPEAEAGTVGEVGADGHIIGAAGEENEELVTKVTMSVQADNLRAALEAAQNDPRMVANIIRNWIAQQDEG